MLRRLVVQVLLTLLALGGSAALGDGAEEFVAKLRAALPAKGSIFAEFGSANGIDGGRLLVGFDIASGAFYKVQAGHDGHTIELRTPGGEGFRKEEQQTQPVRVVGRELHAMNAVIVSRSLPPAHLYDILRVPSATKRATNSGKGWEVEIDASDFDPKDTDEYKLEWPRGPQPEFLLFGPEMTLQAVTRGMQQPERMESIRGLPAPFTMCPRFRTGWELLKTTFEPDGAPKRFEIQAVVAEAREKVKSYKELLGPGPNLTELAKGVDSKGAPIRAADWKPGDSKQEFRWRAVTLAGLVIVAIGLVAWWRSRR